jgi:hypothetical protein
VLERTLIEDEIKRSMLQHFLAALVYRTQKALRDAPPGFADFDAGNKVRTPHQLVRHMDSVLGYARTFFVGGAYQPPTFPDFQSAVAHFHEVVTDLAHLLEQGTELHGITPEILLQGPFSDAMTHAGQLSLLRRLAGDPVAPENFIHATISCSNLGINQPLPVSPDKEWPEKLPTA